ncbi:recombinase zinc beta ribbon domain-containing protein [Ruminococcus bicirculans (ex Wegman et al. 2014)]
MLICGHCGTPYAATWVKRQKAIVWRCISRWNW